MRLTWDHLDYSGWLLTADPLSPSDVVMGGCKALLTVKAISSCYISLRIKFIHRRKINLEEPKETELKLHPISVLSDTDVVN